MATSWKPVVWTIAALSMWLLANAADRSTEIEVYSDGGRLHLTVAGTTLSAPIAITSVTAIEIRAMDSIDPLRGVRLSVTDERGKSVGFRTCRSFFCLPAMTK